MYNDVVCPELQLFLKADVNLSALTQLAIAQSAFYGSTIKASDSSSELLERTKYPP